MTGETLNRQITLHGTNNPAGGKLGDIDTLAILSSPNEINREYTLTLPNLATVKETGSFQLTFRTPVI